MLCQNPPDMSEMTSAGDGPAPSAGSVLLVEDHIDALDSMRILLEVEGFKVTACATGTAALEAVKAGLRPSVAVIDISLPDMNGFQVARRLRELNLGSRCHLLALSGWSEDGAGHEDSAAFDGRLTKPVDIASLLTKLRDLLG